MIDEYTDGSWMLVELTNTLNQRQAVLRAELVDIKGGSDGNNTCTFKKVDRGVNVANILLVDVAGNPPGDHDGKSLVFFNDVLVDGQLQKVACYR